MTFAFILVSSVFLISIYLLMTLVHEDDISATDVMQ
jgi:hypothetical protein